MTDRRRSVSEGRRCEGVSGEGEAVVPVGHQ